jgi:hypothetical protein
MSQIIVAFDDENGEPSLTFLRHAFLAALREELPGIVDDLWERSIPLARTVLSTARPDDSPDHLLAREGLRLAADRLVELDRDIERGASPVRLRYRRRAKARAELWSELVAWAAVSRLTDAAGNRNPWLLDVVAATVRQWCVGHAAKDYPEHAPTAASIDWALPAATTVGRPSAPAPQFRRREHTNPRTASALGPLARDWRWLVLYAWTEKARREFAPGVNRATVVQQVRAAAAATRFELPVPLRLPKAAD